MRRMPNVIIVGCQNGREIHLFKSISDKNKLNFQEVIFELQKSKTLLIIINYSFLNTSFLTSCNTLFSFMQDFFPSQTV